MRRRYKVLRFGLFNIKFRFICKSEGLTEILAFSLCETTTVNAATGGPLHSWMLTSKKLSMYNDIIALALNLVYKRNSLPVSKLSEC